MVKAGATPLHPTVWGFGRLISAAWTETYIWLIGCQATPTLQLEQLKPPQSCCAVASRRRASHHHRTGKSREDIPANVCGYGVVSPVPGGL